METLNQFRPNNTFWLQQISILLQRAYVGSKKDFRQTAITLFISLVRYPNSTPQYKIKMYDFEILQIPCLSYTAVYSKTSGRTQESIQDVRGAIFMLLSEVIFSSCYSVLSFYPSQMPMLRREINENMYNFSAFYIAETLWKIPYGIIRSLGIITATYLFFGFFKGFKSYLQFVLTMAITTFTATADGFMMTGLFNYGREMAPLLHTVFVLVAGFYINLRDFPYLRYISLFYYSNEALTTLYWYDVTHLGKKRNYLIRSHVDNNFGNCLFQSVRPI